MTLIHKISNYILWIWKLTSYLSEDGGYYHASRSNSARDWPYQTPARPCLQSPITCTLQPWFLMDGSTVQLVSRVMVMVTGLLYLPSYTYRVHTYRAIPKYSVWINRWCTPTPHTQEMTLTGSTKSADMTLTGQPAFTRESLNIGTIPINWVAATILCTHLRTIAGRISFLIMGV